MWFFTVLDAIPSGPGVQTLSYLPTTSFAESCPTSFTNYYPTVSEEPCKLEPGSPPPTQIQLDLYNPPNEEAALLDDFLDMHFKFESHQETSETIEVSEGMRNQILVIHANIALFYACSMLSQIEILILLGTSEIFTYLV